MNKYHVLIAVFIALTTTFWSGCNDDEPPLVNEIGSQWEESGKFKLSTFTLPIGMWEIEDSVKIIHIRLQSHTDNKVYEFDVKVHQNVTVPTFSIYIPKTEAIPDSDYDLTAYLPDGTRLGTKLRVYFEQEMLHMMLGSNAMVTGLEGEGTKESPYLIGSKDDFDSFEYFLYKDSANHGKGIYFQQTATFDAPPRSDAYQGRYYAGYIFAGIYDGGNFQINLSYIGSKEESDTEIGLFSSLEDGAHIKNLSLNVSMQGIKQNGGALSGKGQGNVSLTNVKVSGHISDSEENLGGFIGHMNGNLTAKNCRMSITLSGKRNIGGLVGQYTGGTLTVDDFSNFDEDYNPSLFSVKSTGDNAGALCGIIKGGCQLSNVTIQHSISEEDKRLEVIYTEGNGAGGIFGTAEISQPSSMETVEVLCPVRTKHANAGGLVGKATLTKDLSLQGCLFASYVESITENAGGFFGHLKSDNHLILAKGSTEEFNNRIVLVSNGYLTVKTEGENAGGMFGYLEGNIQTKATSTININVTAKEHNAGGIAGVTQNSTIDSKYFSLGNDMSIFGNDAVGGLVGAARNSTIKGSIAQVSFDKISSLPKAESFKSDFGGSVKDSTGGNNGTSMGGIVGYAYNSYIENLCFSGLVSGNKNVGGIVGHFRSKDRGAVTHCVNRANAIKSSGSDYIGGIIGQAEFSSSNGHLNHLINYTDISGANLIGGIVGCAHCNDDQFKLTIEYVVNAGDVSGTRNVGGCVGLIKGSDSSEKDRSILNSANYGNISGSLDGNVGGIIGEGNTDRMRVMHCANHGKVSSSGASKVGGIAGRLGHDPNTFYHGNNMEMAYCCNRGTISSSNKDSNVGGLLGYQEEGKMDDDTHWMTHDCYNTGKVTSDQDDDNGGIIGFVDHYCEIRRCINVGKVSHGNGIVGTREDSCIWYYHDNYLLKDSGDDWCANTFSSGDKKKKSTFENFNFNDHWAIDNEDKNNGYPYLRNCPFQFISK